MVIYELVVVEYSQEYGKKVSMDVRYLPLTKKKQ